MSQITVTAFAWVPPFAQGLVRDLRVRWALEEAGLPYRERLIGIEQKDSAEYRRQQPFGQVPVYQEDDLVLFESGAIVLHVAERSHALLPRDPAGRARARTWAFAALNSVEPAIQQLAEIDLFYPDEAWAQQRRPGAVEEVRRRLEELAGWLGDGDYLEAQFSAGDLLMATVLKILRHTELLAQVPTVDAYYNRCVDRPAYQRALEAQMAAFRRGPLAASQ